MHSTQVESKSPPPQEEPKERDLVYPAEVEQLIKDHGNNSWFACTYRVTQRLQDIADDAGDSFNSADIKKLLRALVNANPSMLGESQLILELKKKFGVLFIKIENFIDPLARCEDIVLLHECGLASLKNIEKYFDTPSIKLIITALYCLNAQSELYPKAILQKIFDILTTSKNPQYVDTFSNVITTLCKNNSLTRPMLEQIIHLQEKPLKNTNEILMKLQAFKLINLNNVKFIFEQQVYLHFMIREMNGHDNFSQAQFDELIVGKIHHTQLTMLDSCLKRKNKMIFNLFLPHSNLTPGSIVKKFIVGDLDRGFKKK